MQKIKALKKGLNLTGTASSERENLKEKTLETLQTSWNKRCALKGRGQDQIDNTDVKVGNKPMKRIENIADQSVASVNEVKKSWKGGEVLGAVSRNTLNVRKFKDAAEKCVESTKGKRIDKGQNVDIGMAKRL